MRRLLTILAITAPLTGCDYLVVGDSTRVQGDYDAVWSWDVDVEGGSADDGRGSCDGQLRLDRSSYGSDRYGLVEFDGYHTLAPVRACLPRRSGRVAGDVDRSGRIRMALELADGYWGAFEYEPDCDVLWRDTELSGELRSGRIRADARARYRCWISNRWGDVDVTLRLDAQRWGR